MQHLLTPTTTNLLVLIFCFSSLFGQGNSEKIAQLAHNNFAEKTLILKMADSHRIFCAENEISVPEIQEIFRQLGVRKVQKVFATHSAPTQTKHKSGGLIDLSLIYRIQWEGKQSVAAALTMFKHMPAITYIEPAYIHQTFYQPNDPFADTSNIGPGQAGQWSLVQIDALRAWDIQRGEKNIVIGVVDSGHKSDHEDMQDNLFINTQDPIDGLDNDNDGYIDNYAGWDFGGAEAGGAGDNDPNIGSVHGFFVAGILGATTDNGIGIAGTSFNCSYLPIKASPDDSLNAIFYGYEGIVYAVDQGAKVVNCSWGGPNKSKFGSDVVQYATKNKGAALVVAAGNSRSDVKFYPAAYPEALSVANTSYEDVLYVNSTYNYTVNVSAPGWNILTTSLNQYGSFGGTSAAAPVAAGALGIVVAHFDDLTPFQASHRMRVTTDDVYQANDSSIYEDRLGTGRINLYRALTDPLKPSIRQENFLIRNLNGNNDLRPGDTLTLDIDFINYLHASKDLNIELSIPSELQAYMEIDRGYLAKAEVEMWERFDSQNSFRLILKESVPYNLNAAIKINYVDEETSYEDFEYLEFRVNKTWLDIEENQMHSSVNSYGNFGFNSFGQLDEGVGVKYEEADNALFEGGFLIGNAPDRVYDRIRNNFFSSDTDFSFSTPIELIKTPTLSEYEALSRFSDAGVFNRLGLNVDQHSFAFVDTAHDDYLIFQFVVENRTATPIADLYAGLFADWDILGGGANLNSSDFDANRKLVFARDVQNIDPNYYGFALLTDQDFHAYATTTSNPAFTFTNANKYTALSNIPDNTTARIGGDNGGVDVSHFISGGPFTLAGNGSDTLAFALLAGNSLAKLQRTQEAANLNYQCRILDRGPNADFLSATVANDLNILFSDQNVNASTWSWDFGDGAQAFTQNPFHDFDTAGIYTVTLQVSDGTCSRTFIQSLAVGGAVPIEPEWGRPGLTVFPNPAKESFRVFLEGNWYGELQLNLLTIQGQQVWEKQLRGAGQDHTETIEASNLAKGMYILRVSHKNYQLNEKLRIE